MTNVTFKRMVEQTLPIAKYIELVAPIFHQQLTDNPPKFGVGDVALYLDEPVLITGVAYVDASNSWSYQSPGEADGGRVWFAESDLTERPRKRGPSPMKGKKMGPRKKRGRPASVTPPAPAPKRGPSPLPN